MKDKLEASHEAKRFLDLSLPLTLYRVLVEFMSQSLTKPLDSIIKYTCGSLYTIYTQIFFLNSKINNRNDKLKDKTVQKVTKEINQ